MNTCEFGDSATISRPAATESKVAAFNLFFDIKQIRTLCVNHALGFAHNTMSMYYLGFELDETVVQKLLFFSLPKPFKVYACSIDNGSGARKAKQRLDMLKK
ncbi:MAG: hypothetical protein EXX96DRAFT_537598 [Benjaminiella poitrasii]|nr:MAG: hypothetical protein EXX96DRAFT_537598 [Benjaminiella poitrasii]